MTAQHLLYKMTWEETQKAVEHRRVVVIPVGAIEQHGPHMPVDTDNVIAVALCEEASRRRPDILACAMHIPYGYNAHNMEFPGTVHIRQHVFTDYVFDVCASYAKHGFRYILLINAHGSNAHLCEGIARQVSMQTSARCGWLMWNRLTDEVFESMRESDYPGGTGHACEMEASMYLAIDPANINQSKAVKELTWTVSEYWYKDTAGNGPLNYTSWHHEFSRTGIAGDPTVATAEKGHAMIETFCDRLPLLAENFRNIVDEPRFRDLPIERVS